MTIRERRRNERTLGHVWADVRHAGPWVVSGIITGTVLALTFVFLATPFYRAQMIIAPASPMNGTETSSLLSADNPFVLRFSAQNGVMSNAPDFLRFESMYAGPTVAARLLQDDKIFKGLSYDRGFGFLKTEQQWTPEKLAEYIDSRVRLEPVGATPLRRMVYLHPSREFAVYLLHRIQRTTDDIIRSNIRAEAGERVAYLQDASDKTNNPDHRRVMTALLMEQERMLMLASIDQPYAAAVIEPPAGSSRPKWPVVAVIFPVFIFIGALLGLVLHGLISAPAAYSYSNVVRRQGWFRADSQNNNDMPLFNRNAAE